MSSIAKLYALASMASLAITLAAISNGVAQEQSDQSSQSAQQPSDQQEQKNQQEEQQRQQQEQERQRQQERQQQEAQRQERQQQSQQRDQQSRDRDQSLRHDSDSSRDREWPQPAERDYGSDSLRYGGSDHGQQGGLGVGLSSDGRDGVLVSHVHSGSPAEEMGVRTGDRITAVSGQQIHSVQQFIARIRNMDPGQRIELDIRRARGGSEQTVRGELESRQEALAEHADQGQRSDQQQRGRYQPRQRWSSEDRNQSGPQDRSEWQTSYDERGYSQDPRQVSTSRIDQIERQFDRLSRELDDLRVALQTVRRQSGQSQQWDRERTARYEGYEDTAGRHQSDERFDGRETYRQADRDRNSEVSRDGSRGTQQTGERDDSPGGETGEDRLHVGSEDIQDRE